MDYGPYFGRHYLCSVVGLDIRLDLNVDVKLLINYVGSQLPKHVLQSDILLKTWFQVLLEERLPNSDSAEVQCLQVRVEGELLGQND